MKQWERVSPLSKILQSGVIYCLMEREREIVHIRATNMNSDDKCSEGFSCFLFCFGFFLVQTLMNKEKNV